MMLDIGLNFRKLDLHLHTPGSTDFVDKAVSPKQIVEKALTEQLDGIAVTDHNSGNWVDKVKEAAKGTGLVVFPGVEISCEGGKEGIHLIALFDIDKDSAHVAGLLSRLNITPEKQGNTESLATGTLSDIIREIQSKEWQGVAIPAHASSSKGILARMRGEQRTMIIQNPSLIAVEASCFQDEELKSKGKRAIDLLDGNDSVYKRKLAVYQASDNPAGPLTGGHGLWGIGTRCAYFKMEKINLESLRQCLLDSDVRIVQDFEFEQRQYPRIARVSISNGFFEDETVLLNQGLNSVIGGKGTGKSLLIELMRFVLNQAPDRPEIRVDHDRKLEKRLGKGSFVELDFLDATNNRTSLKRIYDPSGSYYDGIQYDPAQVQPVLFLSQNEIIRIAEDVDEQLKFIDRFFNFRSYRQRISSIEEELAKLDSVLKESILAFAESLRLQTRIATIEANIAQLDRQLGHSVFEDYRFAQQKNHTINSQTQQTEKITKELQGVRERIARIEQVEADETHAEDPKIRGRNEKIIRARDTVLEQLEHLMTRAGTFHAELQASQHTWDQEFKDTQTTYDEYVASEGGDYQQLAGQRQVLVSQAIRLREQLNIAGSKRENLASTQSDRNRKLDELEDVFREYRAVRQTRCQHFQEMSHGRLRLQIRGESNTDAFAEQLIELKTGSRLYETDVDIIVRNSTPRRFISLILQYLVGKESCTSEETAVLNSMVAETQLGADKLLRLINFLVDNDKLEEVLRLQYKAHPEDRPEIKYNVGDDEFVPLDSLSVGQKSTALLIMALSDEQMPVVIDQPEDSLDIRSIWEDICSKVRVNKTQRQFIFTTHNSNVSVASDSDNYIILAANSDRGRIVHKGSMDHRPVSDEVLTYMEGGPDSYRRKFTKYRAGNLIRR